MYQPILKVVGTKKNVQVLSNDEEPKYLLYLTKASMIQQRLENKYSKCLEFQKDKKEFSMTAAVHIANKQHHTNTNPDIIQSLDQDRVDETSHLIFKTGKSVITDLWLCTLNIWSVWFCQ